MTSPQSSAQVNPGPHPEVTNDFLRAKYLKTYPNWDKPALKILTDEERAELAPSLSTVEICNFRDRFCPGSPALRFKVELQEEYTRIQLQRRELQKKKEYFGPTLVGDTGELRAIIMARSTIRKRWEALGIWDPNWGAPSGGPMFWDWPWRSSNANLEYVLPDEIMEFAWPTREQECWWERTIRLYLQGKGEWKDPNAQWKLIDGEDVRDELSDQPQGLVSHGNKAALLTGQTWWRFELEAVEHTTKMLRVIPDREAASALARADVVAKWEQQGAWDDAWVNFPAWEPPAGVTLPAPESVNDMKLDDIERYALSLVDTLPGPPFNHTLADLILEAFRIEGGGAPDPTLVLSAPPVEGPSTEDGTPPAPPPRSSRAALNLHVRFHPTHLGVAIPGETVLGEESAAQAQLRAFRSPGELGSWAPARAPTPPPSPRLIYASELVEEDDLAELALKEQAEQSWQAEMSWQTAAWPAQLAAEDVQMEDATGASEPESPAPLFPMHPWWTDDVAAPADASPSPSQAEEGDVDMGGQGADRNVEESPVLIVQPPTPPPQDGGSGSGSDRSDGDPEMENSGQHSSSSSSSSSSEASPKHPARNLSPPAPSSTRTTPSTTITVPSSGSDPRPAPASDSSSGWGSDSAATSGYDADVEMTDADASDADTVDTAEAAAGADVIEALDARNAAFFAAAEDRLAAAVRARFLAASDRIRAGAPAPSPPASEPSPPSPGAAVGRRGWRRADRHGRGDGRRRVHGGDGGR